MGCGQCDMCRRALPNMCPDYTAFGITLDGSHAQYVRIPRAAIVQGSIAALPEGLSWQQAALIEPLSCALSGVRAARLQPGDTVVVFGTGPIGLMHVMLARLCGAARVLAADPRADRLEHAAELGATAVIDGARDDVRERVMRATGGRGADAIITACSVAAVQQQAIPLLAPFGRLCLFGGLPAGEPPLPLDTNLIHYRQLVVTGVTGGAPRDFHAAMRLVASGRVPLDRVVSHRFPIGQMAQAFNTALGEDTLKVVLWQED
jgi:threonine dehydrogenase-like Zn-dependent dehydrogenase